MAKINRFNGNVKAIAADSLTGERSVFGTTATVSDDLTDQYNAAMLRGWGVVGASDFPPLEWFNAMAFTATQFIAYLHQMGVAEWNALQEYPAGGYVNRAGVLYVCKTADHVSATVPESDTANWRLINATDVSMSDGVTVEDAILKIRKSLMINPRFNIWERGTSFTVTSAATYTADRTMVSPSVVGSIVVTQEDNDAAEDSDYYAKFAQSSGQYQIEQRIKSVRSITGNAAIKIRARANGAAACSVYAVQRFGTGGSSTIVTTLGTINIASSSSFSSYELTGVIPSTSGKTIGAGSSTAIAILFPSGSITIDVDSWQVDKGTLSTDMGVNDEDADRIACKPYYRRIGIGSSSANIASGMQTTTTNSQFTMQFDTDMRVAPSVSFNDLAVGDRVSGLGAVAGLANSFATNNTMLLNVSHSAYGAGLRPAQLYTTTVSGYIAFDSDFY